MNHYRVAEWGRLSFGSSPAEGGMLRRDAVELCQQAERFSPQLGVGAEDILCLNHSSLQARQVVGVISTPASRLEILPKIGAFAESRSRHALLEMLATVFGFPLSVGSQTSIREQGRDILEILISVFTVQLMDAVQRGLPRAYIENQADLPRLRGALNVTRQFSVLAASPEKLACRFDALSADIPLNRVLKAACALLQKVAQSRANQRRLSELLHAFDEVASLHPAALPGKKDIHLDRTNERYRMLLDQARLFLQMRWQSIYSGNSRGFALLFQMNTLFEAYIGTLMRRLQTELGCRVTLQGPHRYAMEDADGTGRFMTKPDICVDFADTDQRLIIDTKWKRLDPSPGGSPWGISNSDVYQMLAYGEVYDAERVILLYPNKPETGHSPGLIDRFWSPKGERIVDVATVELTGNKAVQAQLSNLLEGGERGPFPD